MEFQHPHTSSCIFNRLYHPLIIKSMYASPIINEIGFLYSNFERDCLFESIYYPFKQLLLNIRENGLFSLSPGGNTPQSINYTATCLPSRKLSKLDEPGHCWRSRDELINDVLLWTPTYGLAKAGWPARTYIQQVCEDTGCSPEDLPEAMNNREKWRERECQWYPC